MNQENKICQNCKKDFIIEPEDFDFYEKMKVPAPTWCPECRLVRRMAWRNERFLYRKKDANSGKEIFSIYSPGTKAVVYDQNFWISDGWDQNLSGREYNWNKPFFEQFKELLGTAPLPSLSLSGNIINSDYSNQAGDLKDCYLVFGSTSMENCTYVDQSTRTKDCFESTSLIDCQLCYECFFSKKCYRALYCKYCEDSQDIIFCKDCIGCSNCIGCVNLRNKSYYIFNQPYAKEDYFKKLEELGLHSRRGIELLQNKVFEFWKENPVRYVRGRHNFDTTGEYISNSKNVHESYYVDGGENLKFCQFLYAGNSRDSYDHYRPGGNTELIYESDTIGLNASQIMFSDTCTLNSSNVLYSFRCIGVSNVFGCVGIHHKKYCILNKQYTKEEYETLVPKIIEHMKQMPYIDLARREYKYGEFFPPELSPYPYNVTVAQEFFPLKKNEAEQNAWRWEDIERKDYAVSIKPDDLPDSIYDAEDSLANSVIQCKNYDKFLPHCPGAFKIIERELKYYKTTKIPLPQYCPNCRHYQRTKLWNPMKLWHRKCMKPGCTNEFETSYAPDRPEIVYCETCYNAEVA